MPATREDGRPEEDLEVPLEDAAAVLHEPVDLARSFLDEAELGTDEAPRARAGRSEDGRDELEEREEREAADERDATLEAEAVLVPPAGGRDGDVPGTEELDPEELEARLEAATEAAELLSLHGEELLDEALLDEGLALDELDAEAVEEAVARARSRHRRTRRTATPGRPAGTGTGPFAAPARRHRPGKIDVEKFRRLLESERARLEELDAEFEREGLRERSEREDLSSLSAVDQHPADVGTETFDRERDLSIREQVEGELVEVARAIRRIDDGTYGRCEACGGPIGARRLTAEPAARLCLDDQRELERERAVERREVEP